jgi:ketosteroid isomerase-like protein
VPARPGCGWPGGLSPGHYGPVTDHETVREWLAGYETAWRSPGTAALAGLFTADATYLTGPYREPVTGLAAIGQMWEAKRDGPAEIFTLATQILAVDGETAVVRAEVAYGDPVHEQYRDLWVLRLGADGRCHWFEEWPFSPDDS